jgi:hypothetical protein
MRSYASRAVHLRLKTLANPQALGAMSQDEKQRMEKAVEIASVRTVLLRRERSVTAFIKKNSPKLLAKE